MKYVPLKLISAEAIYMASDKITWPMENLILKKIVDTSVPNILGKEADLVRDLGYIVYSAIHLEMEKQGVFVPEVNMFTYGPKDYKKILERDNRPLQSFTESYLNGLFNPTIKHMGKMIFREIYFSISAAHVPDNFFNNMN